MLAGDLGLIAGGRAKLKSASLPGASAATARKSADRASTDK